MSSARWPSDLAAQIAIFAAFISAIAALGSMLSAFFAGNQALSARISADAATETLRRSDEDLRILADVDRAAPITVDLTVSDKSIDFKIRFSASAKIINTRGSPAVVMDSEVTTYATASVYSSRSDIFDASTGVPWSEFVVIHPGKPLRLKLFGQMSGNNHGLPIATKALASMFAQDEHQSGNMQRQFDSLEALRKEVRSRAGEEVASEFKSFLYGPAAKPGPVSSNPWSEKGEIGWSRIILKISTTSRRIYRSSPGLLAVGPDPAYSIPDVPQQ